MMSTDVAPALKELLDRSIDYAGIFPPAAVSLQEAIANFRSYQTGKAAWMLRSLVVAASDLVQVPQSLDRSLSVLAEAAEARASSIETKDVVIAQKPVYCEVPVSNLEKLEALEKAGCFAKIRTGGMVPAAIPSASDVASFILACAERRLPFKATAGLHHPIRARHALTYNADSPQAVLHGFLNVLMASAFAWHGESQIEPILSEMDSAAFRFDSRAHWRDMSLDSEQIRQARHLFIHSIGSCSFAEPVSELQAMGLLKSTGDVR